MVLTESLILLTCCFYSNVIAKTSLHLKKHQEHARYNKEHDVIHDWIPNKLDGIQDRFHPVTVHHVKSGLNHPSQLINPPLQDIQPNPQSLDGFRNQLPHSSNSHLINPPLPNQNTQIVFIRPNPQSSDGFRNQIPEQQILQEDEATESQVGEINPALVSPVSFQTLDFPDHNHNHYIAYVQNNAATTAAPNNSLETIFTPWIYIPPSRGYQNEIDKPHAPNFIPPKSSYLRPEPTYLPPPYTYPPPTYLPPPPPPPTYLPPPRTYLPSEPKPGYSYLSPPIPDEKEKAAEFTYFFLGRKLWYIPLYFSIYFVLYVGYLVLKAIARHKLKFPHLLHNAAVVSERDLIQLGLFTSRDFSDTKELLYTITQAAERRNL